MFLCLLVKLLLGKFIKSNYVCIITFQYYKLTIQFKLYKQYTKFILTMKNLPEGSKSIKITSVANGYTVEMPTDNNPLTEIMGGYIEMMKDAIHGGEMSDLDKLIKESLGNVPAVPTVNNVHIFTTFPEVLSFLAQEVK